MSRRYRVVVCVDNRVGYEVLDYLTGSGTADVCAVLVHPSKTALHEEGIARICERHGIPRWDIETARKEFDTHIAGLAPDFLVSVYFDYILDDRFLRLPSMDAINLHPGYLPFNKGFYYYVWSVLDGTPAGVSLHRMAASVDAGDIIAQARIDVLPEDTGETLYRKHEDESIRLFRSTWPSIVQGEYKLYRQLHEGTRHKLSETRELARLDPYQPIAAVDLINRLRVCTFPGASGCTIELGGRLYQLNLTLSEVRDSGAAALPGKRAAAG